jgi:hypothetical protein
MGAVALVAVQNLTMTLHELARINSDIILSASLTEDSKTNLRKSQNGTISLVRAIAPSL